MFDRGQTPLTKPQGCAQLGVAHLAGLQPQQRQLGTIQPADPIARHLAGLKPHLGVLTTMQSNTFALDGAGPRPGLAVINWPRVHQNFQPTPRLKRQLPVRS